MQDIALNGYTMIRADRDNVASRKSVGQGLCFFVHNKVCTTDWIYVSVFQTFVFARGIWTDYCHFNTSQARITKKPQTK